MNYLVSSQNSLGRHMDPSNASVEDLVDIIVLQKITEPSEAVSCSFDHNPRPNKRQHTAPVNWADLDVSDDELKTLTTSGNTKVRPSPHVLQPIQEETEMATFISTNDHPLPFDGMEFHTTTTIADDSYETRRKFLKRSASSLYDSDNSSQVKIQMVPNCIYICLQLFCQIVCIKCRCFSFISLIGVWVPRLQIQR